jgi:hypothetical protein
MPDLPVGTGQFIDDPFERLFAVHRSEMTSMGMDAPMK